MEKRTAVRVLTPPGAVTAHGPTDPGEASILPTILNVDDDDAWRELKSRVLESAGFRVEETSTGTRALTLARKHRPALVLLDVHLPGVDGFEVCRRLKRHRATRGIPVLHVTAACVTDADWAHGLESGADSYLIAPFSDDVLLGTVTSLVQRARYEKSVRLARAHALKNLRQSERRYRDLVLHAPYGICTVTGDGQVLVANRLLTRMLAYQDPVGISVEALFKTPAEWREMRERWGHEPTIEDRDVSWRAKDGRSLTVRLTGRLIETARGESPASRSSSKTSLSGAVSKTSAGTRKRWRRSAPCPRESRTTSTIS